MNVAENARVRLLQRVGSSHLEKYRKALQLIVAMWMLLELSVLCGSCMLRSLVSRYPFLDVSWDYGSFHTRLAHLSSLGVWGTLPVVCVYLSLMVQKLSCGLELELGKKRKFLALGVTVYNFWMISFIYCKWVTSFAALAQLIYIVPSVTFLYHSWCQMQLVFASWKCPRNAELHPSWPAFMSIMYNIVMTVHFVTIVASQDNYDLFVALLFGFELLYRVVAIYTFSDLLRTHLMSKKKKRWLQSVEGMASLRDHLCGLFRPHPVFKNKSELVTDSEYFSQSHPDSFEPDDDMSPAGPVFPQCIPNIYRTSQTRMVYPSRLLPLKNEVGDSEYSSRAYPDSFQPEGNMAKTGLVVQQSLADIYRARQTSIVTGSV